MVDPLSESGKTFYLETEYQCRVCGDMFFSAKSLREHVADRHCDIDDYVETHGELETRAVLYTCAICSQVTINQCLCLSLPLGVAQQRQPF